MDQRYLWRALEKLQHETHAFLRAMDLLEAELEVDHDAPLIELHVTARDRDPRGHQYCGDSSRPSSRGFRRDPCD